jgi:DNA-binding NtrC family response regulator
VTVAERSLVEDRTPTRTGSALPHILIADDQADVRAALRLLLEGEGYRIESAGSPAAILEAVDGDEFDAVLMDLNYAGDTTSGQEGLDLVARLHSDDSTRPIVVMTAWGSVEVAVEAMRRGARGVVQKPWENARVLTIVRTQVELARALRRQRQLEAENRSLKPDVRPMLIADAVSMRPVLELIARVGPSEANVLVTGENGTGKSTVAQALHAVSARADQGLVTVNASGLSEGVFQSELFGYAKGAFADARTDRVGRVELADGGTLFIDEVANVPLNLQPKLLRVLETGDFERAGSLRTRQANVRIVSATSSNLSEEVAAGRFRQDLLFRLNTIEIQLPPLRARREDILALATHFLRGHAQRHRKDIIGFAAAALQALLDHPWPGNIRELDHAVERGVLMAQGTAIHPGDLGLRLDRDGTPRLEDMSLEDVEGFLIKKTMARFDGNVSLTAKALGLTRSALYRRLQRYGL